MENGDRPVSSSKWVEFMATVASLADEEKVKRILEVLDEYDVYTAMVVLSMILLGKVRDEFPELEDDINNIVSMIMYIMTIDGEIPKGEKCNKLVENMEKLDARIADVIRALAIYISSNLLM